MKYIVSKFFLVVSYILYIAMLGYTHYGIVDFGMSILNFITYIFYLIYDYDSLNHCSIAGIYGQLIGFPSGLIISWLIALFFHSIADYLLDFEWTNGFWKYLRLKFGPSLIFLKWFIVFIVLLGFPLYLNCPDSRFVSFLFAGVFFVALYVSVGRCFFQNQSKGSRNAERE